MSKGNVYYSEYLQLDKILDAQMPESKRAGNEAHDEMLFVITHQTYELWFKQVLHEIQSVTKVFNQDRIVDTSPDLQIAVHRLKRVVKILEITVKQVDVIETMTPLDFLDFRDMLRPASGFQSIQFKQIEAEKKKKMEDRFGKQYYTSQLETSDKKFIENVEKEKTLIELLNDWLERMPFWEGDKYWNSYVGKYPNDSGETHVFWKIYRKIH